MISHWQLKNQGTTSTTYGTILAGILHWYGHRIRLFAICTSDHVHLSGLFEDDGLYGDVVRPRSCCRSPRSHNY